MATKEELQQAARDRGLDDTGTMEELQAKIDEHDASHAAPPEPEPAEEEDGPHPDPAAREVVGPDPADSAVDLHNAVAALDPNTGGLFSFHESKPVVAEESKSRFRELLDKVNEEAKKLGI